MLIYDEAGHLHMLGKLGNMQISSTSRALVSTFSSLWEVSWQEKHVLTSQELTNAYEKIMEQRRGSDDKGFKVCPFFSDVMG